jgi:DNA-binding NtrC family response regulator
MAILKRILAVDDEESVLLVLDGACSKINHNYEIQVEKSTNGEEAIAKALEGDFDLIITDIKLPGIDGVELTEKVKASKPQVRVIWITAYGCQKLALDAERLSVYRCLDKPLEIGQIRAVVREALSQSDQDRREAH